MSGCRFLPSRDHGTPAVLEGAEQIITLSLKLHQHSPVLQERVKLRESTFTAKEPQDGLNRCLSAPYRPVKTVVFIVQA